MDRPDDLLRKHDDPDHTMYDRQYEDIELMIHDLELMRGPGAWEDFASDA